MIKKNPLVSGLVAMSMVLGSSVVFAQTQTQPTPPPPPPPSAGQMMPQSPMMPPQAPATQPPQQFQGGEQGGQENGQNFQPPMMPPQNFGGQGQGNEGGDQQQQQEQQQRQQENDARMLKQAQQGVSQMSRMIASMQSRIASIEKRGGVVGDDVKSALSQASDVVGKAKSAATMDEFQSAGLDGMGDVMQTINDGMQKAEMSVQFPMMLKQANRILAQQQKALAKAKTRAATLKINVDAILAAWQKSLDDVTSAIAQAQSSFQAGNTDDAISALQDNVFGAMQDIGSNQQIFEMVANTQRVMKTATRELASIAKKIARLKKQGKDTTDAESALADAQAALQTIQDAVAQPNVDPDTLMGAIQDGQDARDALYSALSDLTGQNYAAQNLGMPEINSMQFQAPQGLQQFMTPPPMPQGQPMPQSPQMSPQGNAAPAIPPQSLGASVFEAFRSAFGSLEERFKALGGR